MSFQVSPGVRVREIDLTNVVPAVSSSIGAFAGAFSWGQMGVPTQVTSENDLAEKFGTPNTTNNTSYFTAAAFLQYGNDLRVIRAFTGGTNAVASLQNLWVPVHSIHVARWSHCHSIQGKRITSAHQQP